MPFNWICITFTLLLSLSSFCWSAPMVDELTKFGELERTLKELATSVLVMSGAALAGHSDGNFSGEDMDVYGSEAAHALIEINDFRL